MSSGRITFDDLFDNNYVPIEGTDPVQYRTKFLALLEQVLPPIQNPVYDANPNMTLCAAIDRNGYIPVHRPKHSQPQRPGEPSGTNATAATGASTTTRCGSRRRAARGPTPSSSSATSARASMLLIRSVAAPIRVFGKHWGAIRTTYRI